MTGRARLALAGVWGAAIGALGGLIGLGGAEFRLPVLIGVFRFATLEAIILNKAMSLVTVSAALPFRAGAVPFSLVAEHWSVIANLLAGSLLGAWAGAGWATRLKPRALDIVIAALLAAMAVVLAAGHGTDGAAARVDAGPARAVLGVAAGFVIGVVASLLGVAGGELLIPTLVLLYGADIRLAGSLSLAISLPTMLIAFARYRRDGAFAVLGRSRRFVLTMAAGSVAGAFVGGRLLGIVPEAVLTPALAAILLASAVHPLRRGTGACPR